MSQPRVTGLWIYPIKSCRGISLQEMEIGPTGPLHDRQWMIVDESNQFITLRSEPKLSQILTEIKKQELVLHFNKLQFKINFTIEKEESEIVIVWKNRVFAGIEADSINTALSQYLGYPVKLVRYQSESGRPLGLSGTAVSQNVMFADSKPILLVNEASVQDLNLKLQSQNSKESEVRRFRGNIIIEGLPAFAEDEAQAMKIKNVEFRKPSLCSRCPIVTQSVETGLVASKETLITLASYRKLSGSKVLFGVYWTPSQLGQISVGDEVEFNFEKLSSKK